jgi:hypothetical protein
MGAQVYCHRILGKGAANLGRQDFLNAIWVGPAVPENGFLCHKIIKQPNKSKHLS